MRSPAPTPGLGSMLRAWVGFSLLILAQFGVRPLIPGRVAVDFALIAVLFSSVRMRPGFAALTGFAVGVALDALAPDSFGASALVLTLIAFGASWLKAVFFADHVGLTGLFVFGGKWLFDIATTLLTGVSSGTTLVVALLVWAPLSAALTALVAVLLLVLFRPLYRPQAI
ncbi:MAG: rod shape-determining protein MreD [Gemmatimonadaceae bacterium]|nr:rod shape-determining protein MreD [Gemmatimonadaceae bacterium]